jgi:NADH-quinone oxidoreductase subunit M
MYKRIFFGKIPEQYVNVKDPNRYVIVTMAVLAAMTLVLGVYPDPLLTPLTGYIQSMFEGDNSVLPIPTAMPASAVSDVPVRSNIVLPSISLGGGT